MVDALPLPEDLIELQRAVYAAQRAAEEYGRQVDAERRALYPGEDQYRERMWPEDGPERAELARLRDERDAAMLAVRHHPTIEQAYAEGAMPVTGFALMKAAKADTVRTDAPG